MHRAFSLDDIKSLVRVVAMHVVLVPWVRVIMDPGVKALGVDQHFSLLELMSLLDHIDDLDRHTSPPFESCVWISQLEYSLLEATSRSERAGSIKNELCLRKEKGHFADESGLSEIGLHRVDEFRNCFLYKNIFETIPQFQAVELAIARM
jgi:hypothetical protein